MESKILTQSQKVIEALLSHRREFMPILSRNLTRENIYILDNSEKNSDLASMDISNVETFTKYIFDKIKQSGCLVGIGKYLEDRVIYRHSSLFAGESESRSLHLGIDVFVPTGTPLYAPLNGTVHSFRDNAEQGDYGPTIIIRHELDGVLFYTLYGHLSRESMASLRVGQNFASGDRLAEIGATKINGGWPPHVHFEIITDMLGRVGDFFGVAPLSRREYFANLCPDPNLILQIPGL